MDEQTEEEARMRTRRCLTVLAAFLVVAVPAMATDFVLVSEAQPQAEIVLAEKDAAGPALFAADRFELAKGRALPANHGEARICVSSGRPIDGCDIKIVTEGRLEVPDGTVGELAVTSVSLFRRLQELSGEDRRGRAG
jgi:hypothetical protein